jgi:c-di-GMP-binding flagellar brake protein YcgR
MPEHEQPAAWDGERSEYAQYLLHSPQEIAQVLRAVSKSTELVTGYFDHGTQFFLTSIVAVQPGGDALFLDYGIDAETNRRALQSSRLVFVTTQDRVKVQFATGPLEAVEFNGRPAFRTHMPLSLLKLQRREYYRLATPLRARLSCSIPTGEGVIETSVTDISVGGTGLSGFPGAFALEPGQQFAGCRIALPEEGAILAAIEVRSIQEVTLRNGTTVKRVGCRFLGLAASQQAMIQRYIARVERERVAMLKGS